MPRLRRAFWILITGLSFELSTPSAAVAENVSPSAGAVALAPCHVAGVNQELRCGVYEVYEDRQMRSGRKLPLRIIIMPAIKPVAGYAPIFIFVGGPGQSATDFAVYYAGTHPHNDVVFIDQRGTGEGHRLDCANIPGSPQAPEGYLEPVFQRSIFRTCRSALERNFDLTKYTTPIAMDDYDEVRQALGYDQINLEGGSYGSRAILEYLRNHGTHVRAVWMQSPDPYAFRNPLFHARSAEESLDGLLKLCLLDAPCAKAYPNPRRDLETVFKRLSDKPAKVRIDDRGKTVTLVLTRETFAEGLRAMLYDLNSQVRLPYLLRQAARGYLEPFAKAAFNTKRVLRDSIHYGMLQTVICSEDAPRIRPWEIALETDGTFLGDTRVRQQLAACEEWPRAQLPSNYATPFESNVPAIIVSDDLDPATPPRFGDIMTVYLPNSLHVVIPGGHSTDNQCAYSLGEQLFGNKALAALDLTCINKLRRPPFYVGSATHHGSSSAFHHGAR